MKNYQLNSNVIIDEVEDGNCVIFNSDNGLFYELNTTGKMIVKGFEDGIGFDKIKDKISAELNVDRRLIDEDAEFFVSKLNELKILEEKSQKNNNS